MDTVTNVFEQYASRHGITLQAVSVPENPNMHRDSQEKPWEADHWYVTLGLVASKKNFTLYFSKGVGLRVKPNKIAYPRPIKPSITEILECLQSDFSGLGEEFEEWASGLGYDTDSRKAERTWETVKRQAREFRALVGIDAMNELMGLDGNQ